MTRISTLVSIFVFAFSGVLAGQAIISDSPEHALISSENHDILAPGSSRDFRHPRITYRHRHPAPVITRIAMHQSGDTIPWNAGREIPLIEDELPGSLYSLSSNANGWTLKIREQPLLSSVVILGPTIVTAQGRITWALRSITPVGNTNKPEILWCGTLLGPANGLYFLATSLPVDDPGMGRVFRIEIPKQVVYGYWETGIRGLNITPGSFLRVRLYGLGHGYQGAQARTYRIPIH
ncbi:MAG TPA: hypothetical protein PLD82_00125 [Spirochaetota bacterium]|nr:hypothetical protein [Spirochaetota bacterium]